MGWFDKKSWQLRRKIKDLQSDLAAAEREGKYVVEQGLFFAELAQMGDATMMVLGKADTLDTEEETVIRNFLERNGFSVETLRLDRSHKTLSYLEIIPPEEFTRRVAKGLKDAGYRLIDDSDHERESNLQDKTVTLSCLIRTIAALFTSHVNNLIVSTPIKFNMEGNRLLHWMPLMRDFLLKKVPADLPDVCKEPFVAAYNHYYGRLGRMESTESLNVGGQFEDEPSDHGSIETELSAPQSPSGRPAWEAPKGGAFNHPEPKSAAAAAKEKKAAAAPAAPQVDRPLEAAMALSRMYKSLIGASEHRKLRNAEVLLDYVRRFFDAASACVLVRPSEDSPWHLVANSGSIQCVDTDSSGLVTCDTRTITASVSQNAIVTGEPSNGDNHPSSLAAPLLLQDAEGALFILTPKSYSADDHPHVAALAQVFKEFPDLLLQIPAKK